MLSATLLHWPWIHEWKLQLWVVSAVVIPLVIILTSSSCFIGLASDWLRNAVSYSSFWSKMMSVGVHCQKKSSKLQRPQRPQKVSRPFRQADWLKAELPQKFKSARFWKIVNCSQKTIPTNVSKALTMGCCPLEPLLLLGPIWSDWRKFDGDLFKVIFTFTKIFSLSIELSIIWYLA